MAKYARGCGGSGSGVQPGEGLCSVANLVSIASFLHSAPT